MDNINLALLAAGLASMSESEYSRMTDEQLHQLLAKNHRLKSELINLKKRSKGP